MSRMMFVLLFLALPALACGNTANKTAPTPTRTPIPTWTSTPAQVPEAAAMNTPVPVKEVTQEQPIAGIAVGAAFEDAYRYALTVDPSDLDDDKLVAAFIGMLQHMAPAMERLAVGEQTDDDMILLDACFRIGLALSFRTDSITIEHWFGEMANACTEIKLDTVAAGRGNLDSLQKLSNAVVKLDELINQH